MGPRLCTTLHFRYERLIRSECALPARPVDPYNLDMTTAQNHDRLDRLERRMSALERSYGPPPRILTDRERIIALENVVNVLGAILLPEFYPESDLGPEEYPY